jgi:hypothetical protein
MKKASIAATTALALSSVFATTAMAKDIDFKACSGDGHTASLTLSIPDDVLATTPVLLPELLRVAWVLTAASLPANTLVGHEGRTIFQEHAKELIDTELLNGVAFTGPPAIGPAQSCRVSDGMQKGPLN